MLFKRTSLTYFLLAACTTHPRPTIELYNNLPYTIYCAINTEQPVIINQEQFFPLPTHTYVHKESATTHTITIAYTTEIPTAAQQVPAYSIHTSTHEQTIYVKTHVTQLGLVGLVPQTTLKPYVENSAGNLPLANNIDHHALHAITVTIQPPIIMQPIDTALPDIPTEKSDTEHTNTNETASTTPIAKTTDHQTLKCEEEKP